MTLMPALAAQGDETADADAMRAARDEPAAFTRVFDAHFATLHGYLRRRLGEPLAEELAAETFARAFDDRARYDPARASVRAWLHGIAANLVRDHHRGESRRLRAYERAARGAERHTHDDAAAARLDAERAGPALARALSTLRAEEREALLLFAWADLGYEEIAAALGIPVGTVRSRLHRGRRRVQLLLEEEAGA